jgi:hypothetical protein
LSSLVTAVLLTLAMGSITNHGATGVDERSGAMGYFVDALFRKDANVSGPAASHAGSSMMQSGTSDPGTPAPLGEVGLNFSQGLQTGALPERDLRYVGNLVVQRTGLSQQEAEKRVNDIYARSQASSRDTQAILAQAALWLFIALLSGAIVASLGGQRRDASVP